MFRRRLQSWRRHAPRAPSPWRDAVAPLAHCDHHVTRAFLETTRGAALLLVRQTRGGTTPWLDDSDAGNSSTRCHVLFCLCDLCSALTWVTPDTCVTCTRTVTAGRCALCACAHTRGPTPAAVTPHRLRGCSGLSRTSTQGDGAVFLCVGHWASGRGCCRRSGNMGRIHPSSHPAIQPASRPARRQDRQTDRQ